MSRFKINISGQYLPEQFDIQPKAYQFLVQKLKKDGLFGGLQFEIWTTLVLEYQMEQVGFYPDGKGPVHQAYMECYSPFYLKKEESVISPRWYPSISFEHFCRSFPMIPHKVLDLTGDIGSRMTGHIKWKVVDTKPIYPVVKGPPPGLGKAHRLKIKLN